jgi:mannose/cellobiose epimerase-like protein (N-acyl-D-glucosamine 2-epimerase family)
MVATPPENPVERLHRASRELSGWLANDAYPLWASRGFDPVYGGFHETLDSDAQPAYEPRRIRVQLRQVYCFARARSLGWTGEATSLVTAGLSYVRAHYRRPDGLFRTLVAPDGAALDDRALLYDQAFVLLALAECQQVLGPRPDLVADALQLRDALYRHLERPDQGFSSSISEPVPLLSNPHMHLLEAALGWMEVSSEPGWRLLADEIVALALGRFIDPATGALREQFAADWSQLGSAAGSAVEPGHLFEWAWLLLRWSRGAPGPASRCAERFVEVGETCGIRGGVAVYSLLEDLTVDDPLARLWAQTERLKAAVSLLKLTQDSRHTLAALAAVDGLSKFLTTRIPGLWHDCLMPDGRFAPSRVPASSFYHLVCAIAELATVPGARQL